MKSTGLTINRISLVLKCFTASNKKIQIAGSFDDIIKTSVSDNPKPKLKKKKAVKNETYTFSV